MYKKVYANDIDYLKRIAPGRVFCDDEINEDYNHDELSGINHAPEVLIKIKTTEEASEIMRYANENRIPVVVRGSGTGLVGGSVAIKGGIMIETTLMNHILELDEDNLTVTVEPGVLLMELSEYVENRGFFYPPDPGEKSATIGGNISTNAGGMRAVKYGVTRDYIRGLTVVLPDGRIIELGGKMVKNSTGYNFIGLISGSEGTLGIITKAVLKLLPLPAYSVSLLIPYPDMDSALETVPEIIKSRYLPTAVEYMSLDTILFAENYLGKKFPNTSSDAYLLLTFDGESKEAVQPAVDAICELCLNHGALDAFFVDTEERKKSVWSARGAFLEAIKASTTEMDECDVVVPRSAVAEFIKYTHALASKLNVRILSFGHAGDGNLHVYICRDELDDESWSKILKEAFDSMYEKAKELSGLVSGEHGIGYAKREYMKSLYGKDIIELMRSIKLCFDPNNILNPEKVI